MVRYAGEGHGKIAQGTQSLLANGFCADVDDSPQWRACLWQRQDVMAWTVQCKKSRSADTDQPCNDG